jgi:hypothetical protein
MRPVRVCLDEIRPRPPLEFKKPVCMDVYEPPDRAGARETRFFSSKKYWFRAVYEVDLNASYLQVGLKLGLVRLWWGGVEFKSVRQFKEWFKQVWPYRYVATPDEYWWGGWLYKSPAPRLQKTVLCQSLDECVAFEAHIYKMPYKFLPQILMGWAKRHYGLDTIDYVASVINRDLRKLCAASRTCAAHVHDGLVFSGPPDVRPRSYEYKEEERIGWSWFGVVAPGDPPRFWGFMPNEPEDIVYIDRVLREAGDPAEAWERLRHLALFDVFEQTLYVEDTGGLVDLGTAVQRFGAAGLDWPLGEEFL